MQGKIRNYKFQRKNLDTEIILFKMLKITLEKKIKVKN